MKSFPSLENALNVASGSAASIVILTASKRTRIVHPKFSPLLSQLRNGLPEIFHSLHRTPALHASHLIAHDCPGEMASAVTDGHEKMDHSRPSEQIPGLLARPPHGSDGKGFWL
jgi:hypothetical protein